MPVNAVTASASSIEISTQLREARESITPKNKSERAALSNQVRGADAVVQGIRASALLGNKSSLDLIESVVRAIENPQGTRALLLRRSQDDVDVRFDLNATASQRFRAFLGQGTGK